MMLSLLLFSCSEMRFAMDAATAEDSALEYTGLRIDVLPSQDENQLQPQSFYFPREPWSGLQLQMKPSVLLSGRVEGFAANPQAEISIPGESSVPISGSVTAWVPGSVMERRAEIVDGEFSLSVASDDNYQLLWIPDDPMDLPMIQEGGVSLLEDTERDLTIDYGLSLSGTVTGPDGSPVEEGLMIWLEETETGLRGPAQEVRGGSYRLRASPGQWDLVLGGDEDHFFLPQLRQSLFLLSSPQQWDFQFESLEPTLVSGRVTDQEGDPLDDVRVVLSSDMMGGAVEVETMSDQNGYWSAYVLPGDYRVDYIPEHTSEEDPLRTSVSVPEEGLEISSMSLSTKPVVLGNITNAQGLPLEGASLQAWEDELEGALYAATTDSAGNFAIQVSSTELTWRITPASDTQVATRVFIAHPDELEAEDPSFELGPGEPVSGCILFEDEPLVYTPIDIWIGAERQLSYLTDQEGCFSLSVEINEYEQADSGW